MHKMKHYDCIFFLPVVTLLIRWIKPLFYVCWNPARIEFFSAIIADTRSTFSRLMLETKKTLVDTHTKLYIVRSLLDATRRTVCTQSTCFLLQQCLQMLIQCKDLATLYELFHDDTITRDYARDLRTCLADYREADRLETFFHLIVKSVRVRTRTHREEEDHDITDLGGQVLRLVCEYGANPFSFDAHSVRGISYLPFCMHRSFLPYQTNVTLENLVVAYERTHGARAETSTATSGENTSFTDPIHWQLMRHPMYCASDGCTYDCLSLQRWLQDNNVSPMTHPFIVEGSLSLYPNWTTIRKMRDWLEPIVGSGPAGILSITGGGDGGGTKTRNKTNSLKKRRCT